MNRLTTFFLLCVLVACNPGEPAAGPATAEPDSLAILNFGVYTSDKASDMVRQFRPALSAIERGLQERLGERVEVRMQVASSYQRGLDDLVEGRVDFSRFGPASYVLAKDRAPGIELLAMESKNGERQFYGIICVPAESPVTEIEHLAGRTFAFGDSNSTIGRYLSQAHLLDNGIAESDLAAYEYLDRHDRVGAAVAQGRFGAGALKESTFKKLVAAGEPLRELARFPNVTKPWVVRAGMDAEVVAALRETLLALDDQSALAALKKDGFLPAEDSHYAPTRAAIRRNPEFFGEQVGDAK